jgi:hypothetical protein
LIAFRFLSRRLLPSRFLAGSVWTLLFLTLGTLLAGFASLRLLALSGLAQRLFARSLAGHRFARHRLASLLIGLAALLWLAALIALTCHRLALIRLALAVALDVFEHFFDGLAIVGLAGGSGGRIGLPGGIGIRIALLTGGCWPRAGMACRSAGLAASRGLGRSSAGLADRLTGSCRSCLAASRPAAGPDCDLSP